MDADDLVRAIRAALDDTEAKAHRLVGDWTAITLYPTRGEVVRDNGEVVATTPDHETAAHIAHNGPAAVLRRVAADRRVLERHMPRRLPATHYRPEVIECEHCVSLCHSRSGLACDDPTDAPWPCDEIRDLADRLGINPEEETS